MFLTEAHLIFRGIRPLQRLGTAARHLVFTSPLADIALKARVTEKLRLVPPDPWPGDPAHGRDMISGIFHFAGQTVVKDDLSWEPATASPEWLSELHSFEWLRNLRSVGGERARRMAREMVSTWFTRYPKYHALAWRPDITGARLKSWILFHDFFCASADDEFRRNYFASLTRQTLYLAKSLPGTLSGVPLMQALKGLAYTGLALEGGETHLEQAFNGILRQIREQILPDGGHISRSPQATFEFLQCLVDLRAALISAKMEMPEELQHAIDRIAPAVKFFRHGDGALAQFNGGQEGNAHLCETTLMHSGARGKAMPSMPHSGYERIVQGRSSAIMDTGLPLTSSYCDRAHAGLLSFEYSFGRDRVIVNCGTTAVEGKWRRILRSTLAHSTLTADNRNSCQFDDEGRLSSRPGVRARRQEDGDIALIEASHNGYVPRFGLTHRRCLRLQEQGDVLCGEDQLTGKSGVPFVVRFHLHPGIEASLNEDGNEVLLRARSGTGWRFKAAGVRPEIEESIYVGKGESPLPSLQIVLTGQTAGAATTLGWEMRREEI
jgi:uncharacterized heparinase superfamily protein